MARAEPVHAGDAAPAERSPPLPSGRAPSSELPVHLTSFVGREADVLAVRALLDEGRLVTLTGAGGSGKTRLAVEAAAVAAADHPGAVRWVELASLARADLLAQHVASAVGVGDPGARSWAEALVEEMREASLLLVLDNCEHLVDACAHLAETLLKSCPAVRILATSREALGIWGERAWLVPALSLPAGGGPFRAGDVTGTGAVRLFVQRARAVAPSFAVTDENATAVARICQRLDGLPLAIELAAARVRVLAPEQIADRLEGSFSLLAAGARHALPRHRTLREVLDWSHALLGDAERRLLRRLSVFAGSFSLAAVERVCADDEAEAREALDLLTALVDKSLVLVEAEVGEARYRLLETVRQYARERLDESGEAEPIRKRHAWFFLALAEALAPETFGGLGSGGVLELLDAETPNLRAAGDYFERDDAGPDEELRLYAALDWYWFARARLREGRRRITAAVEGRGEASPRARGRALASLAAFAFWQGDHAAARSPAEEGVRLLRDVDDAPSLCFALANLGMALILDRELDRAREVLEEAVGIARRIGDPRRLAFALYWRARAAKHAGELEVARAAVEEAVVIGRRHGWAPGVAHPGTVLARVQYLQRDYAGALLTSREVLRALREIDSGWGLAQALRTLAAVVARVGRTREAVRLHGANEALLRTIGSDLTDDERREHEQELQGLRAALGDSETERARAEGLQLDFVGALALAEAEVAALEAGFAAGSAGPPPDGRGGATPAADAQPATPAADDDAPAARRGATAGPPRSTDARGGAPAARVEVGPPPSLRVLALGPLEIHREGERIPADAWSYARPRELLVYLLCHPEGRTRDQIGVAFWPDGSAAQLKNSFHVTLHHLRRTLGGADWVVIQGDRYRLNPDLTYAFDAVEFEAEVRAALARGSGEGEDRAGRLASALALYRGEFLEGEVAADWHLEPRDRWRRLYVEGLLGLGNARLTLGEPGAAVASFRRVVLLDDLHEEAYRKLMTSLARTGERGEAARQYARLVEALGDVLDAAPEPETTSLMERIRRGEKV